MFGIPEEHINNLVDKGADAALYPEMSVIEECSELMQILGKAGAERVSYEGARKGIIEEMTHVLVSLNMLAKAYDISMKEIKDEIVIKAIHGCFDYESYIW